MACTVEILPPKWHSWVQWKRLPNKRDSHSYNFTMYNNFKSHTMHKIQARPYSYIEHVLKSNLVVHYAIVINIFVELRKRIVFSALQWYMNLWCNTRTIVACSSYSYFTLYSVAILWLLLIWIMHCNMDAGKCIRIVRAELLSGRIFLYTN